MVICPNCGLPQKNNTKCPNCTYPIKVRVIKEEKDNECIGNVGTGRGSKGDV